MRPDLLKLMALPNDVASAITKQGLLHFCHVCWTPEN